MQIKSFTMGSFGTNMYLVSGESDLILLDHAGSSLYEQQMVYRSVNVAFCQAKPVCQPQAV